MKPTNASAGSFRKALRYSTLGLEMGLAVGVGYLAGSWVDGKLGTAPIFLMVFVMLGIVAGMREVYRAARRFMREAEPPGGGPPGPEGTP